MSVSNSLPYSFESNTQERILRFLKESNELESINNIDYTKKENQEINSGHFGALVDSQFAAIKRTPLTIKMIKKWQEKITQEQLRYKHHIENEGIGVIRNPMTLQKNVKVGNHTPPGYEDVPTLLDFLVEKINHALKNRDQLEDDSNFCKFIGETFYEFERIHPFIDGNGRTGRILLNYLMTCFDRPLIIFESEIKERNQYYKAHSSAAEMCKLMAKKVQEAVFDPTDGSIYLPIKKTSEHSTLYQQASGNKKMIYKWHSLQSLDSEA